jgi:hypothetical protein
MMVISSCQLLGRALAYALIAVSAGKGYAVLAVGLEVILFYLYKLARRDFYHKNAAKLKGFTRILASSIERFNLKIISDFTSIMLLRNPSDLGGKFIFVSRYVITKILFFFLSFASLCLF